MYSYDVVQSMRHAIYYYVDVNQCTFEIIETQKIVIWGPQVISFLVISKSHWKMGLRCIAVVSVSLRIEHPAPCTLSPRVSTWTPQGNRVEPAYPENRMGRKGAGAHLSDITGMEITVPDVFEGPPFQKKRNQILLLFSNPVFLPFLKIIGKIILRTFYTLCPLPPNPTPRPWRSFYLISTLKGPPCSATLLLWFKGMNFLWCYLFS